MKTTISIPDEIFEAADRLADELGISRSELYSMAIAEHLAKHRTEEVTDRLNEVYAREESGLAPELRRAQARSVGKTHW